MDSGWDSVVKGDPVEDAESGWDSVGEVPVEGACNSVKLEASVENGRNLDAVRKKGLILSSFTCTHMNCTHTHTSPT